MQDRGQTSEGGRADVYTLEGGDEHVDAGGAGVWGLG